MSNLNCETLVEPEIAFGWYSVMCGQATYDVRALSEEDASSRVTKHLVKINEKARLRAECRNWPEPTDTDVGLPFVTEYIQGESAFKEQLWLLTGGLGLDGDNPQPRLVTYTEELSTPSSSDEQRRSHEVNGPQNPSLFTLIGGVATTSV